ncbi:MAG: TRAP transporter substrate-binding protein DctP [Chloroflexi bacterium]|nr:TRAP transporter substrate-binding protein DctP [Chloroflexota bacterium]
MRARHRLATIALALTTIVSAGCTSGVGSGDGDKAGGIGEPVVLRMANASGQLDLHPSVAYFVDRVEEHSGGDLRIEAVNEWGDFAPDAEQQVVRGVSSGEVDLGWAGTRVFDTLGVESFQALTAPMLVDSYALQGAVIESGITERMMEELDDLGVVGLGVLPDGLRKPIGVIGPIVGPEDWQGITFAALMSDGQAEAIRALGATPIALTGTPRDEAADERTIQGLELGLLLYPPTLPHLAPYVTSNVNLWPLMDVLLANPDALADLTAEQRGWLEEAAREAAARSATFADSDAELIDESCAAGARFAEASDADLAALEAAFAPVSARLREDPETNAFLEQIDALKRSTPAESAPAIPAGCAGETAEQTPVGTATVPAYLNGTYRYGITLDEAREADMVDPEDEYPNVVTVTLSDGELDGGCFGAAGGRYEVFGDRLVFHSNEYDSDLTVSFTRDHDGSLHLTPILPMDRGDAFVCFSQVWTKID